MSWRWRIAAFLCFASMVESRAAEPPGKTSILLDCAIGNGVDEAFALALATADPTLELLGVTTVSGNTEDRAWMVARFLSAIGKGDVPVASGRGDQPKTKIGPQYQYRYHPAVLYGRTARPVKQSAVALLHDLLTKNNEKATIVCTGPLTNVAQLLAEHPDAKERIERIIVSESDRSLAVDAAAAKHVLESEVPMVVIQRDVGLTVQLDDERRRKIFAPATPLTLQLQTLFELDPGDGFHPDIAAIAVASQDQSLNGALTTMPARLTSTADGHAQWTEGESHARIVKSLKAEPILDWMEKCLSPGEPALPRELANRTQPIERGGMPNRVHVFEDYETDIERRWWLAGIPGREAYRKDSSRHCRGMLTMDFDDLQGDTKTMYRAVVFNPVPGPPMGKNPRLSFRCWLDGTDELRVQIYSLSNGYHRYLSLAELPQEKWLDLTVDMTAARRSDGSGGPLSEGERIDDIQFYVDPRAKEFRIDDIVLYDAAAAEKKRPFPKRILFTGWFDTGKQGLEWPGDFEIPDGNGYFWKAARSIDDGQGGQSIRVHLRGRRPLGKTVQLEFRYQAAADGPLEVVLKDTVQGRERRSSIEKLESGAWQQASLTLPVPDGPVSGERSASADEILFTLAGEGPLLMDDVLLFEEGK